MASSGRPDIGISAIPYAPIRQIRQNSPLSGLFPKSPSTVPFLSNFFSKIFASPPLTVRKSEQKRYTLAALFSKKFVSPLLTIAKTPKKGHTLSELFFKKLSSSTEVISQMLPPCVAAFRKKSEKHHLYPVVYHLFTPILLLCFSTFLKKKHSSSIGVISKTAPCCVATFEKKSKNLLHTTDYQDYPPVL